MGLRDHRIKISQQVKGDDHWSILSLSDASESRDGTLVTGSWKHTSESYTGKEIKLTDDNEKYLYWEFRQPNANGGTISIGSKMGVASHRADQKEFFQVLVTLYSVKRIAGGHFRVGSVLKTGAGTLT